MPSIFDFNCPTCNRVIKRVSSDFIGKRANCKACGAQLVVPDPSRMKVGVDPRSVEIDYEEKPEFDPSSVLQSPPPAPSIPKVTPESYWPSIESVVPQPAAQKKDPPAKPTYQESFAPVTAPSTRPPSSGAVLFIAWVVGFVVFINVVLFCVGFMNAATRYR